MTSKKHAGESKLYVKKLYRPQNIFDHTWGPVSGSMNSDPENEKFKGQQ